MSKRESKKEHILWAGLEVMRAQGYNGTSVKDIVDAAGVPKGSFYNYFKSKEAFAVEALEAVSCEDYKAIQARLNSSEKLPMQRLHDFFEQSSSQACDCEFKVGCFFGNMAQEMADSSEAIRRKVSEILNRNTRLFADILDEARAKGQINADANSSEIAEYLLNGWEGALLRMKASRSRKPLDVFLKMLPRVVC